MMLCTQGPRSLATGVSGMERTRMFAFFALLALPMHVQFCVKLA